MYNIVKSTEIEEHTAPGIRGQVDNDKWQRAPQIFLLHLPLLPLQRTYVSSCFVACFAIYAFPHLRLVTRWEFQAESQPIPSLDRVAHVQGIRRTFVELLVVV